MKAIILAAGQGIRLGNGLSELPKCLLKIGNKTIVEKQLESLASAGIEEISIVIGAKGECWTQESFDMIKKLSSTENLFAGPSTGTVLAALNKTINKLEGKIVLLFGDNAAKYKSIYSKFGVYEEKEFDKRLKESKNNCFTCTYSNIDPEDSCRIRQ